MLFLRANFNLMKPKTPKILVSLTLFLCLSFVHQDINANQELINKFKAQVDTISNDSIKIMRLLNIGWLYDNQGSDSSIYFADKALILAKETMQHDLMAHSHYSLGIMLTHKSNYTDAILNLEKCLTIYESLNNKTAQVAVLMQLGVAYSYISAFSKSLEYYLLSSDINKTLADSSIMAVLDNNIGVLYSELNESDKALEYYFKALAIDSAKRDTTNIILDYNNISFLYLKKKDFKNSHIYIKKAMRLTNRFKLNEFAKIVVKQSLGEYYLEVGQMDSAYVYLMDTYHQNLKSNRDKETAYSCFILAKYFEELNDFDTSIDYYKKALDMTDRYGYTQQNSEIYFRLGKIYELQYDYQAAYNAILKSQSISDSLNLSKVRKTMADYELQKELEMTRLQALLEQQKNEQELEYDTARMRFFIISMIIITLLTLLVLITYMRAYKIKKKAHKKLQDQNKVIQLQKEDLRQVNKTKDKFFSLIAHDLKNPFNIIIGYSELLLYDEEYREGERLDEMLNIIHRKAVLSHTFLENLLDWARSQSGKIQIEPTDFKMNDVINDNVDFFSETASLKNIILHSEMNGDLSVHCDRKMVDTIIRNLISNAIKFTEEGGKVEIKQKSDGKYACISVEDTGVGISKENIKRLFKIDDHFQNEGTAEEKGTGLGLILSKEFIDKNNGHIKVESFEGKGSIFTVSLPLAQN